VYLWPTKQFILPANYLVLPAFIDLVRVRHSLYLQLEGMLQKDVRMTDDVISMIEMINKLNEAVSLLLSQNPAQESEAKCLQPS
jgi:hypothetical protein